MYTLRAGPTLETAAECRALRTLGADVVGMSTAYETVVARAVGLRVLCLSLVTNMCDLSPEPDADATHETPCVPHAAAVAAPQATDDLLNEVIVTGQRAAGRMALIIGCLVERL